MSTLLHGIKTIELMSGTVAIQTIPTAVIGLVGTAPDAAPARAAEAQAGSRILGTVIRLTAKLAGRAGNEISVEANVAPSAVPGTTAILDKKRIIVTLATGVDGSSIAPVSAVVSIINSLAGTPVVASVDTGSDAAAIMPPFSAALAGGQDEAFPLNTPVVVAGMLSRDSGLGAAGTLPDALTDIFDQTGALIVVVRAESQALQTAQDAAVINAIEAFRTSESITGYRPRILLATGFSEGDGVAKQLETTANRLRAIAYVDSPSGATPQEIARRREQFGGRVELLRPRVAVTDDNGITVYRPYSARAAGLRARIDKELGWWWSKSNQEVFNITGLEQADEYIPNEENCTVNLLNMENISTIIRRDGYRHWGNRLCLSHPQWRFEAVRRSADVIQDSIQEALAPYQDRPIDRNQADDIIGSINAFMRHLKNLGAIYGGRAWLDPELNTEETLAAGWLYVNYDFGPKSPMELLTLRVRVNNKYGIEELTSNG